MRRSKLTMSRIRLWKLRSESSSRNNLRSSWKFLLRFMRTLSFEQNFVAELQSSLYRERDCTSWNLWSCIFDNHCLLRSPVHVITFSSKSDGWCLPLLHSRHGTCPVSLCTLRRNFPLQFLSFKFFLSYCPLRSWRWVFHYFPYDLLRKTNHPISAKSLLSHLQFFITVSLRLQLTTSSEFKSVTPEKAFGDFAFCCLVLFFVVFSFMG